MGSRRAVAWVLIAVEVAIIAFGLSWMASPPEEGPYPDVALQPMARPCADFEFIGLRGITESPLTRSAMGEIPYQIALLESVAIRMLNPGARIELAGLPVGYPKADLTLLTWNRDAPTSAAGQDASVLVRRVREEVARCPSQQLILVGHSMGAMVLDRAGERLAAMPQVLAILLFGSPSFDSHAGFSRGDYSADRHVTGSLGSTRLRGEMASRKVLSYCLAHDPICTGSLLDVGHLAIHGSYAGNPAVVNAATMFIVHHVPAYP